MALLLLTPTIKAVTPAGSHEKSVWFLDGNVDYLEGRHIPLFILAIFILFFAVIYRIMIFSWQWVIWLPKICILKWTNNQKLNSFIQMYQAPFNDRHRYWTGLLLLEWVLLTYISFLTANTHPNTQLLSNMMFFFTFKAKNLYKSGQWICWSLISLSSLLWYFWRHQCEKDFCIYLCHICYSIGFVYYSLSHNIIIV